MLSVLGKPPLAKISPDTETHCKTLLAANKLRSHLQETYLFHGYVVPTKRCPTKRCIGWPNLSRSISRANKKKYTHTPPTLTLTLTRTLNKHWNEEEHTHNTPNTHTHLLHVLFLFGALGPGKKFRIWSCDRVSTNGLHTMDCTGWGTILLKTAVNLINMWRVTKTTVFTCSWHAFASAVIRKCHNIPWAD
jgi:hypothetical protein